MTEIIPAIMPTSFSDLKDHMSAVSALVPLVQIDVMDGRFTKEKTWPFINYPDEDFQRILKEEEGFPFWEGLDFEVDLMIKNPESGYYNWLIAGAKRVIIHIESTDNFGSVIPDFKSRVPDNDSIMHIELGLAVNPDTPLEKIEPFIPEIDFIQCMGIARIGYQGEPFDGRVIERIKELKEKHPELVLSVDGGVNLETAPRLIKAGANRLAIGSAIFRSENIRETIEEFKSLGD